MICPKCNSKIKKDSKYCPRCGELFESNDVFKYSEIYNSRFLEIYYPNKSERIKVNGVSLLYMFFTYFYAIYHRMYKCAFYTIVALLIFFKLMPNFDIYVFKNYGFTFYFYFFILASSFVIYFYYVFSFDRLLLEKRKMKINYIIRNNPDKSFEEMKELIINDSKNNYYGVLIAMVISFLLVLFIFYFNI